MPGVWVSPFRNACCALGALVLVEGALGPHHAATAARDLLGALEGQTGSFAHGFDGYGHDCAGNACSDSNWNDAGFRMRKQLIEEGLMRDPDGESRESVDRS